MTRTVQIRRMTISRREAHCPHCGMPGRRHAVGMRRLREIGITGPVVLVVTYSKHYCEVCRKHFSVDMNHLAPAHGRFTNRVRGRALDLLLRRRLTLCAASCRMRRDHYVHVPTTTMHEWVMEALAS